MLTDPGDDGQRRILLTGFDIARAMDDVSGLTATNMTVGTVAYCAPEQLVGGPIDGRADQYALAATAYHLLTGTTIFPHTNPAVVIGRHLTAEPPHLGEARPELSGADPVLAAALAKDPGDRFARCSDFAQALTEQIAQVRPRPAGPTTPGPAAAKPRPRAGAASSGNQAGATTQARAGKAAPGPAGAPVSDTAASATSKPRAVVVGIGAALVILVVIGVAMWWRPWAPPRQTAASTTTSSQPSPAPLTGAPLPSEGATTPKTSRPRGERAPLDTPTASPRSRTRTDRAAAGGNSLADNTGLHGSRLPTSNGCPVG